jgi:hypothetical protein
MITGLWILFFGGLAALLAYVVLVITDDWNKS